MLEYLWPREKAADERENNSVCSIRAMDRPVWQVVNTRGDGFTRHVYVHANAKKEPGKLSLKLRNKSSSSKSWRPQLGCTTRGRNSSISARRTPWKKLASCLLPFCSATESVEVMRHVTSRSSGPFIRTDTDWCVKLGRGQVGKNHTC